MQEREINLIDLIVEVLLRWRMFAVWMLCGAVLLAGYSYVSTWRSARAQAAQVEESKRQLEEEEGWLEEVERLQGEVEYLLEGGVEAEPISVDQRLLQQFLTQLDDDQLREVEYVLAYEELYRDRLSYQEQSILMQMDAENVQKAVVSIWITSENDEKSYAIESSYEDSVQGGRMTQYLGEQLGMTVSNVSELISLSHKTTGVTNIGGNDNFTLTVIHYDEQVCRDMIQAITEFMENEQGNLETVFGKFEVVIVAQEPATVYYPSITTNQRSLLSDLISIQDTITNRTKKFTDEQNLYHDAIAKGEIILLDSEEIETCYKEIKSFFKETESYFEETEQYFQDIKSYFREIADIESLEEIKGELKKVKESLEKAKRSLEETKESLEKTVEDGVTVTLGVSARYMLLGMAMAAFIYAFYIFMIYVLNTKIRISDNLQQLYEIPQLGQIPGNKEEKKLFIFIDKWILSMRNRNKRKFTREEAMRLASVAIKISAERNSVSSVCLIGCDLKEQALAVCEQIKESLDQNGPSHGSLQVQILSNVLYDAQAMSKLENAQGVVLVEQAGSTLYDEISQELQLLNRQGIKALGGIIVE